MRAALVLLLAACAAPGDHAPVIRAISPPHGPLAGGTKIVVEGTAFTTDDAGPVRVLVAGREAPLAYAVDDAHIELVVPPGDHPGEAELVVFHRNGSAVTNGFRYSTPPTIANVAPAEVVYKGGDTVTVTGAGFRDEGAGDSVVLLDGKRVPGAEVTSDSALSFIAPAGRPLTRPRIEVVNARGTGSWERAFRYRPGMGSGLLLFVLNQRTFAEFFDPDRFEFVTIPRIGNTIEHVTSVIRDAQGEYWAMSPGSYGIGRLDLGTQRIEQVTLSVRAPAIVRVGDRILGIDRDTLQLVELTVEGSWTPIGESTFPCCGSFGLAWDGTTLYYTAQPEGVPSIGTVDPATGVIGTPIPLVGPPEMRIEELRAYNGVLYATSRDGLLFTIAPATGVATVLRRVGQMRAMEVFE